MINMDMGKQGLRVFIVDAGARGHALYDAARKSPRVDRVYAVPGNAGIPHSSRINIKMSDVEAIARRANQLGIDLVIAGSEEPLAAGLCEACGNYGIRVCGPSQTAAQLETDKDFAKQIMEEAGVTRTGRRYKATAAAEAKDLIVQAFAEWGAVPVIKKTGLAGGKGVTVPETLEEAFEAASRALAGDAHDPNAAILIEERLFGWECSLFYLCDGETVRECGEAQDYKRLSADPGSPNTGGMGAVSPVPNLTAEYRAIVLDEIVLPVIGKMRERGTPFQGVLYAGLMITKNGPMVVEFNVRFGDPEAEVVLPRMKSDLIDYLSASTERGALAALPPIEFMDVAAVCVVKTAFGYPGEVRKGDVILGNAVHDETLGMLCYHAGTATPGIHTVTNGGRVFCFAGLGMTHREARDLAYENADRVHFDGEYLRTDIARDC